MELPAGLLNGLGTVGLVLLIWWFLATGRFITRREADGIIHDRDEWRAEARLRDAELVVKNEQIAEKDRQLAHLSEVGHAVESVMTAIQAQHRDRREESP